MKTIILFSILALTLTLHARPDSKVYFSKDLFEVIKPEEGKAFSEHINKQVDFAIKIIEAATSPSADKKIIEDISEMPACIKEKLETVSYRLRSRVLYPCETAGAFIAPGFADRINICPNVWADPSIDNIAITLIHEAAHLCNPTNSEQKTEFISIKIGAAAYTSGMKSIKAIVMKNYASPELLLFIDNSGFSQIFDYGNETQEYILRRDNNFALFENYPALAKVRIENLPPKTNAPAKTSVYRNSEQLKSLL